MTRMQTEATPAIPYVSAYVKLVPETDVVEAMSAQSEVTFALLSSIDDSRAAFRYAPDKWSIREMVGHLADGERVFGYRAMCIARGEQTSLPGFDENEYMRLSDYDGWSFREAVEQFALLRRANILLFRNLSAEAWKRAGVANNRPIDVQTIAKIIVGHERHHLNVLHERYGLG